MKSHQTRFSDVCGTMDELKRLLYEEYEKAASKPKDFIEPLLEDALFMLGRMKERLKEYKDFREEITKVSSLLNQVKDANVQNAEDAVVFLHTCIRSKKAFRGVKIKKMDEAAEAIRTVAGTQENRLRSFKDLALKVYSLFGEICGDRAWLIDEADSKSFIEKLKRKYQAWLPPQPHCDKLLKLLKNSRVYVLEKMGAGGEPVVQFEDGGSIPMSRIRYDPKIQNFYPASFKPASTGRKYREVS
jgi:hypothetical protein